MRTANPLGKRQAILEATRQLLIKRSFQDFVLEDVAREAGVAKGTLFLYYKNKDELFSAAFTDLIDRLGRDLEAVRTSGKTGKDLLTETVRAILIHFDRNHDFMSNFGLGRFPACGAASSEKLIRRFQRNNECLLEILRACERDGCLSLTDPSYDSFALFGLCRSAMVEKMVRDLQTPVESRVDRIVQIFLNGVCSQVK